MDFIRSVAPGGDTFDWRRPELAPRQIGPASSSLRTLGYVAAVTFFVTLALVCLDGDIKVQHDSGIYITLAKALSTGSGYREIFLEDVPPHTHYPPLFPLLLTPTVHFFGYHLVAMKMDRTGRCFERWPPSAVSRWRGRGNRG